MESLIVIGLGIAIGCSPIRTSKFVEILILFTGG